MTKQRVTLRILNGNLKAFYGNDSFMSRLAKVLSSKSIQVCFSMASRDHKSDISQVFEVDDICRFWMDISGNHQGENVVRSTLTPFI